mgnify:CR=1 FL=1
MPSNTVIAAAEALNLSDEALGALALAWFELRGGDVEDEFVRWLRAQGEGWLHEHLYGPAAAHTDGEV